MLFVIVFLWSALCFYFSMKFDLSFGRHSSPLFFGTTPCFFIWIYVREAIVLGNPRIFYLAIVGIIVYILTLIIAILKIKEINKLPDSKKKFYSRNRWVSFPGFVFIAYLIISLFFV